MHGTVAEITMSKRIADTYLTDRNFDDDDDVTEEVCFSLIITVC